MSKMKHTLCYMAALVGFAACTQDELTGDTGILPPGTYPLQIASVTLTAEVSEQPWGASKTQANDAQTRISETTDGNGSLFEPGDEFCVKFDDYDDTGIYRIAPDGSIEPVTPLYWQNTTQDGNLTAWHTTPSPTADGTIDFSDQTDGLAYLLQARATATFGQPVSLHFNHRLAKVRVELTATDGYTFTNPAVYLQSVTSCTLGTDGTFTPFGSTGYIATCKVASATPCYEATVWPQTTADGFIRLTDGEKEAQVKLEQSTTLQAGYAYAFRITVRDKELILVPTAVDVVPGWDNETEL